jgi:hypothetical protein
MVVVDVDGLGCRGRAGDEQGGAGSKDWKAHDENPRFEQ